MKYNKKLPKEFKPRPIYRRMPGWVQRRWDPVDRAFAGLARFIGHVTRRIPLWAGVLLCVLAGTGIGALVMKQRRDAADVAVVTNGERLMGRQFYRRLELAVGTQALNTLIGERLLQAYAQEHGVAVAEDDVERQARLLAADPTYSAAVRSHQVTAEDLKAEARQQLLSEKIFGGAAPVTEADIRAIYRRETDPANPRARLVTPARIAVHFLASTSETAIRQAWSEMQKGASLEDTLRKHTGQNGALGGGSVPQWTPVQSRLAYPGSFDARINAMKPGETASPVLYQSKWWIVRCDRNDPPETPSLESVRETCRAAVLLERVRHHPDPRASEAFAAFRKSAPVQIYGPRYRELQNTPPQTIGSAR